MSQEVNSQNNSTKESTDTQQTNFLHNLARFGMALIAIFGLLLVGLIVVIVLSPVLLIGGSILAVLISVASVLFIIIAFLALVWYIARKQPDLGSSTDYSLDQSKNVD